MVYCTKCGKINSGQTKFCKECGAEIQHIFGIDNISNYAGFWRRFGAFVIDVIIVNIIGLIAGIILGVFLLFIFIDLNDPDTNIMVGAISFMVGISIAWLYYAGMESSSKQATPGKMAVGIIVTDLGGNRVSFGRATGRHFAKIISAIPLGIGFLIIGFTEKKQGLHDMIAGCQVIMKR
jgi:uncharacterized RDD family membrane protein YckC